MTCKEQEFKLRVMGGLDFCEVPDVFVKELEDCQTYEMFLGIRIASKWLM